MDKLVKHQKQNTMSKKNKNTNTAVKHENPGRPKYIPAFPRSKEWTFTDWMEANGINTNPDSKDFGKGPKCTMLTLRKHLERDMYFHKEGKRPIAENRTKANPRSTVLILKDVTSEPNSDSGLGRRAYLYSLRATASVKRATTTKTTDKPSKSQTPTADALDKIKAALLDTPSTAPVTVPAVTITPEAPSVPETVPVTPLVTETVPLVTETVA
jgi:hypothetical protein